MALLFLNGTVTCLPKHLAINVRVSYFLFAKLCSQLIDKSTNMTEFAVLFAVM